MPAVLELSDTNYSSFIQEHYEDEDVIIAKVNVAKNPKLAKKFMVQSVPLHFYPNCLFVTFLL